MKTTERPWGYYTELYEDEKCKIKKICVMPGQRLSLQSHKYRKEFWKILSGKGIMELSDLWSNSEGLIEANVSDESLITIDFNQKHRIHNTSETEPLEFIEIQMGSSFSEDDIIRYQDDYGRTENGN
jgi:mannose-6-phosphate isomerase-like protein (cupin superfamily)